jgi:hypothetical protein
MRLIIDEAKYTVKALIAKMFAKALRQPWVTQLPLSEHSVVLLYEDINCQEVRIRGGYGVTKCIHSHGPSPGDG